METRAAQRARVRSERLQSEVVRIEPSLDITEDLTEDQLAELAFAREIVVYRLDPERRHGIIVGYEDPDSFGGAWSIPRRSGEAGGELLARDWRAIGAVAAQ